MWLWQHVKELIQKHSEIVALVGILGVIFSILQGFLTARWSKSRRLLAYATRTFRILRRPLRNLAGLSIIYNASPVDSLSLTRIAVWNAGNESLRRNDIPQTGQPIIYAPDGVNVFEADIIEATSDANDVKLGPVYEPITGYAVDFEFLDPGDGVMVEVIHDGNKSTDIRIHGEIIGGRIRRTAAEWESPDIETNKSLSSSSNRPRSGRESLRLLRIVGFILLPLTGAVLIGFSPAWGAGVLLIIFGLFFGSVRLFLRSLPIPSCAS